VLLPTQFSVANMVPATIGSVHSVLTTTLFRQRSTVVWVVA
jgi:hypothetical protein